MKGDNMARFVNTDRLDYLCQTDVFIRKEFIRLKKMNEQYRYRTAEFLIKNNFYKHLFRHHNISFAVFRIHFCDIWEWHIREEIVNIVNDIEKEFFCIRKPDCMWMLKCSVTNRIPCYYCDLAFFWHHETEDDNWCDKLCGLSENSPHISGVEILVQNDSKNIDRDFIRKLCRPQRESSLLQCEFSNNVF